MSSGSIRIIQLPEKSSVNTDDYMAVDSSANGTKKVKFTDLLDDNLSAQNKAADAQATGEAISGLNTNINNTNTRIDNMINSQQNASVTTLWTGTLKNKNQSVTLSGSIANFDFIDVYCGGYESVFVRKPVANSITFHLQQQNMSDDASVQGLRWLESGLTISGTTATITTCVRCYWDDFSQVPVVSEATDGIEVIRIDGVKIGHVENDEIVDARVGANGTTYPTLGDAIRGQVTDLEDDLTRAADGYQTIHKTFVNKVFYVSSQTWANSTNRICFGSAQSLGDYEQVVVMPNGKKICVLQFDMQGNFIDRYGSLGWTTETIVIENSNQYLWEINVANTDDSTMSPSDNTVILKGSGFSLERIYSVEKHLATSFETYTDYSINLNQFWDATKTPVDYTSYIGNYYRLTPISVNEGEKFNIYINRGGSTKQYPVLFVDSDYGIVSFTPRDYVADTDIKYSLTVPAGAAYMLITAYDSNKFFLLEKEVVVDAEVDSGISGLKVSVMGDSISAFVGTIPSGNAAYYSGSNAGVKSRYQMWWSVLCDKTGLEPLIINGWSGSTVTSGVRDVSYKPASDSDRCSALGDGVNDPDIILIAMGVNDYSYNAPLGTWDGTTALNNDTATFRSAYATMLSRIQTNYPNALIVCITPWFMQRGTDRGATYVNSDGLTENTFVEALKEVASIMNCPTIDGTNIGFNRHNYYPTYCEDSPTVPTHPNGNGHYVMGVTIAKELERICRGYIKYKTL